MSDDWQSYVRDAERLRALQVSGLVDMAPDDSFDRLIELAVAVTGAPRGVIALVDEQHTSAISASGFPEGLPLFAPIDYSFCRFVVGFARPFLVEDALTDPRTIGDPAIEAFTAVAWIGFPIEDAAGNVLGNFCLMDAEPREWTPQDIQVVATLAQAASTEVALRQARAEVVLTRERLAELDVLCARDA
jgi:phosphoserine phosphatase RsbU/P